MAADPDPSDRSDRGLVAVGGPPGRFGPPAQPRPATANGRLPGRDARPRVRAHLGHRALRHEPLLGPHGPARPADAGGRAAPGTGRTDHPRPALELRRDASSPADPVPSLARRAVPGAPDRRLGDVRGDDVGGPFLAALQRVARGPVDPRHRAHALPVRGIAVLVAGRRSRPRPMADEPPGPYRLPLHADDPEHVPGRRHPQRDGSPLSALRDPGPTVGGGARWRTSGWPRASCGSSAMRSS